MSNELRDRVTTLLTTLAEAPSAAEPEELMAEVYDELRRLARAYLRRERPDHTLQATALVHEAWLKLVDQERVSWHGRGHFFAVGAKMMRRLLVDHARRHGSVKRGGEWQRVSLAHALRPDRGELGVDDLVALDEALAKLASVDERQAKVVELRFFAGLEVSEVAELLGVSKRTVEGDWTHARAWLARELSAGPGKR